MSALDALDTAIASREATVGVIGLGYVGLPMALGFAEAGFSVVGFDVNRQRLATLEQGESYLEDIESKTIAAARDAGRFRATDEFDALSECDVIYVCVPTPLNKSRDPDFRPIGAAVEEIRLRLRPGQLVVLGSTTYPGTTHEVLRPRLESGGLEVGKDFALAFAPERIDPANKEFALADVPKVVGGETPLCAALAKRAFETLFREVISVSATQSAEMVKMLENTFRSINIALANEMALMCDRLKIDVWEVIEAAATKPYGFMKFSPGPGLGGHCIPVDPTYLSWKMKSLRFPARLVDLAVDINDSMHQHVIHRVTAILNEERLALNGARILVLGVAYKRDVSDIRESPAVDIIQLLEEKGAVVSFHDPHVPALSSESGPDRVGVALDDQTLGGADLVVIATDHSSIDYQWVTKQAQRIFDTRNATRDVRIGREKIIRL